MSRRNWWVAASACAVLAIGSVATLRAASAPAPSSMQQPRGVCYHTDPSDWNCPDTSLSIRSTSLDVASVSVTVAYTDGRSQTVQLPAQTDAVFLSAKSMRNFLVRHYRATNHKKMNAVLSYLKARTSDK